MGFFGFANWTSFSLISLQITLCVTDEIDKGTRFELESVVKLIKFLRVIHAIIKYTLMKMVSYNMSLIDQVH